MEYYSTLKESENLRYITTWANLENITLSERSQIKTGQILPDATHLRSPVWSNSETESRRWAPQAGGGGELVFNRDRSSVLQIEKTSEVHGGDGCMTM